MAMALLCSPSHFTTHHHNPFFRYCSQFYTIHVFFCGSLTWAMLWCGFHFRNQSRILLSQKKCKLKEKIMACSCACSSSDPSLQNGFCRRDLVLFGLSSSLSIAFPSSGELELQWNLILFVWDYWFYDLSGVKRADTLPFLLCLLWTCETYIIPWKCLNFTDFSSSL